MRSKPETWIDLRLLKRINGNSGCSAVQQKDLLDEIRNALQRSVFRFRPTWARIISGKSFTPLLQASPIALRQYSFRNVFFMHALSPTATRPRRGRRRV